MARFNPTILIRYRIGTKVGGTNTQGLTTRNSRNLKSICGHSFSILFLWENYAQSLETSTRNSTKETLFLL